MSKISTIVSISHIGLMGMGRHEVSFANTGETEGLADEEVPSPSGKGVQVLVMHLDNPAITAGLKPLQRFRLTLEPIEGAAADPASKPTSTSWPPASGPKALRSDGPTPAEWVASGKKAADYPPFGFAPKNDAGLRTDGPTLAQYTAAGYTAASYPPAGFARVDPPKTGAPASKADPSAAKTTDAK
jgi:hypothetical protein